MIMYSFNVYNYHIDKLYLFTGVFINSLKFRSAKKNYQFLLVLIVVMCTYSLSAKTYYVSNSGNDSNPGTSDSLAWKTLAKVNSFTPKPGDQILFKRGDTWTGTLTVKASGTSVAPITYGAWGEGAKPVITGLQPYPGGQMKVVAFIQK
jgi:hypothetical protein